MNSAGLTAIFKKQPIGFSGAVLGLVLAGLLYVRSDQIAENQAIADAKAAEAAQMLSNTRHAEGLTKQVDQMQAFGKEVENRLVRSGQLGINLQYFYKLEAENEVKLLDVRQGLPGNPGAGLDGEASARIPRPRRIIHIYPQICIQAEGGSNLLMHS